MLIFMYRVTWTSSSIVTGVDKTDYFIPLDLPALGTNVSIKISGILMKINEHQIIFYSCRNVSDDHDYFGRDEINTSIL